MSPKNASLFRRVLAGEGLLLAHKISAESFGVPEEKAHFLKEGLRMNIDNMASRGL